MPDNKIVTVEEPPNRLPSVIDINGKIYQVQWQSIGTIEDEYGKREYFMPVLGGRDYPEGLERSLTENIFSFDYEGEQYTRLAPDESGKFENGLSSKDILNIYKFQKLEPQLINLGVDPKWFGEDIPTDISVIGWEQALKLAQENPLAFRKQFVEKKPLTEAESAGAAQSTWNTVYGSPTFQPSRAGYTNEFDYMKAERAHLQAEYDKIQADIASGKLDPLKGDYEGQAKGAVVGLYEQAQARITDIEGGGEQQFGGPDTGALSTTGGMGAEYIERERKKRAAIKAAKAAEPQELAWKRLVAQTSRPQRITRL